MPYDENGDYATVDELIARTTTDELPVCGICGDGIRRRHHPTFGSVWAHVESDQSAGHLAEPRSDAGADR